MKKLLFIMAMMLPLFTFVGCSDDEKFDNAALEFTKWVYENENKSFGYKETHIIIFSKDEFEYTIISQYDNDKDGSYDGWRDETETQRTSGPYTVKTNEAYLKLEGETIRLKIDSNKLIPDEEYGDIIFTKQ